MEILGWVFLGLIAGALAKLIMPNHDPGGCVLTMLLGIAGALLAGYIGRIVGFYEQDEKASFVTAVLGAILILALYRLFTRR